MSAYRNYIQDFPKRCEDLLKIYYNKEKANDGNEVTLLLSLALSGFVVPFERLKPEHPSEDRSKLEDNKQANVASKRNSKLLLNNVSNGWVYAKVKNFEEQMPESNKSVHDKKSDSKGVALNMEGILSHIRNALAHGNISVPNKSKITEILFYSRIEDENRAVIGYWCHFVPVDDFYQFLINWFKFIKNLSLKEVAIVLNSLTSTSNEREAA